MTRLRKYLHSLNLPEFLVEEIVSAALSGWAYEDVRSLLSERLELLEIEMRVLNELRN